MVKLHWLTPFVILHVSTEINYLEENILIKTDSILFSLTYLCSSGKPYPGTSSPWRLSYSWDSPSSWEMKVLQIRIQSLISIKRKGLHLPGTWHLPGTCGITLHPKLLLTKIFYIQCWKKDVFCVGFWLQISDHEPIPVNALMVMEWTSSTKTWQVQHRLHLNKSSAIQSAVRHAPLGLDLAPGWVRLGQWGSEPLLCYTNLTFKGL